MNLKRPIGIYLTAIFGFFSTTFLSIRFFGSIIEELATLLPNPAHVEVIKGAFVVVAIFIAVSLIQLRPWARLATLIIIGVNGVLYSEKYIFAIIYGFHPFKNIYFYSILLFTSLSGLAVWYLSRKSFKEKYIELHKAYESPKENEKS